MDGTGDVRERLERLHDIACEQSRFPVGDASSRDLNELPAAILTDSDSSSTSSDGSKGFVGVEFEACNMDEKESWNDHVKDLAGQFGSRLKLNNRFGTLCFGGPNLSVKHIRENFWKQQVVVRLTCVIELHDQLKLYELEMVQTLCRNLFELLEECGATNEQVKKIMVGSVFTGSCYILLEADSSILERLFHKLVESNMKLRFTK